MTRPTNPLLLAPAAEAAWRTLITAADDSTPCRGPHADRWTSDDAEERQAAAYMCAACPITQRCSTYANTAGEKFHVWAGVDRTRRTAATRRTA